MNRRRLLAASRPGVVVAGALLALTACEKPAPIVTVVSGGTSVYAEANTWCFEDQSLAEDNCATREEGETELEVRGNELVGVDVDKDLVDRGWYIELSDPSAGDQAQPQRSEPQTGHYFTFTAPNLPAGASLLLTVKALDDDAESSSGEFRFTLVPKR